MQHISNMINVEHNNFMYNIITKYNLKLLKLNYNCIVNMQYHK